MIENEVDFHGYGTAEIEVQQQPDDINPFKCTLHQTFLDVLDVLYVNPALKVINITLAYQKDENDVDFGVAEKPDVLNEIVNDVSTRIFCSYKEKTFIGDRIQAI